MRTALTGQRPVPLPGGGRAPRRPRRRSPGANRPYATAQAQDSSWIPPAGGRRERNFLERLFGL